MWITFRRRWWWREVVSIGSTLRTRHRWTIRIFRARSYKRDRRKHSADFRAHEEVEIKVHREAFIDGAIAPGGGAVDLQGSCSTTIYVEEYHNEECYTKTSLPVNSHSYSLLFFPHNSAPLRNSCIQHSLRHHIQLYICIWSEGKGTKEKDNVKDLNILHSLCGQCLIYVFILVVLNFTSKSDCFCFCFCFFLIFTFVFILQSNVGTIM